MNLTMIHKTLVWKNLVYQPFANILTKNYRTQNVYNPDGKTYIDEWNKSQYTLRNNKEWMVEVNQRVYKDVFKAMWGINHYIMVDLNIDEYFKHVDMLKKAIHVILQYYITIDHDSHYNQWNTYLDIVCKVFSRNPLDL